jgi:hypothetical protein
VRTTNALTAVTLGSRLIRDAASLRRLGVPITPTTTPGERMKHQLLAALGSATATGKALNAAIGDTVLGRRTAAQRKFKIAFRYLGRFSIELLAADNTL